MAPRFPVKNHALYYLGEPDSNRRRHRSRHNPAECHGQRAGNVYLLPCSRHHSCRRYSTLSVTFTPTDSTNYNSTSDSVMITVTPVAPPSYTLTPNTQSVMGCVTVTLSPTSTNYTGTVSFVTTVSSLNGTPSNVSASAPSVTLTNDGNGTSVLTITTNENAANHAPVAPWTSGGAIRFRRSLYLVPRSRARRRKQIIAVLLTAVAITLAAFSMACSTGGTGSAVSKSRLYSVLVTPIGTGSVANPAPVMVTVTVQ